MKLRFFRTIFFSPHAEGMPSGGVEITIIVRAHNDRETIRDTLQRLLQQTAAERMEILVFDDNSTDGTQEIVAEFPVVRLVPWDGKPYNPARVLNRAVETAAGRYIVFNNSDAPPCTEDAVSLLIAPLAETGIGAVYGNQYPRPDAFPLVRKDYERAFGDGTVSKSWGTMFSLVFSAVRAETARRFRFDEAFQYSEDIDWSIRIRNAGYRVVYVPEAAVIHSHNYSPIELRKRFYNEGRANGMLFRSPPSFLLTLLRFGAEFLRDILYLFRHHEMRYLFSGFRYRWTQRMSAYEGERMFMKEDGESSKD